ncbi:Methylosome subunit pICln [Psilocybe cubensis]|uniref:Methylosome subunit pICln n=2 Tax=Psilocybe cubensis TaxID=181762 RepID=A0ACB8H1I4_PSICU|nr:Methylosome subunit pICln [Psilocybe cubensis]KAH9481731.1 Methylosome subunit pICln [Psilocybe cubensis]
MPSVNLITAVPHFVTQEEHTALVASTPNSFSDIPPVIKHKEENVTVTLDPPLEGFPSSDGVQGTLYVLTSVLAFMGANGTGFSIEYPVITLHAVSRGESGPSIYCQLDESFGTDNAEAPADDDAVTDMRELTIVPQNAQSLEPIFESLSLCASLHPDPQDDEDDGLDDAFVDLNGSTFETFNGDENEELSEVGRAALAHLESIIYDPHKLQPGEEEEEVDAKQSDEKKP